MICIECNNDLGDKGFGIFTCDQCLTLLKYSIEGLSLYGKSFGSKNGLTLEEKMDRWNNIAPKTQVLFDEGIDIEKTEALNFDPKCISCNNRLESVNNVYGRIIVDSFKIVTHYLKTLSLEPLVEVPAMRIYGVPVYKKGWACKECFDLLYTQKYLNDKNIEMRMFETIELPKMKISDRSTTINGAIGRERVSVKEMMFKINPDGSEDVWPDYRGKAKEKVKEEEPVDTTSYAYFMKPKDRRKNPLELMDQVIVDERSNWRNK